MWCLCVGWYGAICFIPLCFVLSRRRRLYLPTCVRICSRWWCLDPTWTKPASSQEAMEDLQGASFQPAPSKVSNPDPHGSSTSPLAIVNQLNRFVLEWPCFVRCWRFWLDSSPFCFCFEHPPPHPGSVSFWVAGRREQSQISASATVPQ